MISKMHEVARDAVFGMEEPVTDLMALSVTLDHLVDEVTDSDLRSALGYAVKNLRRSAASLGDVFNAGVAGLRAARPGELTA